MFSIKGSFGAHAANERARTAALAAPDAVPPVAEPPAEPDAPTARAEQHPSRANKTTSRPTGSPPVAPTERG